MFYFTEIIHQGCSIQGREIAYVAGFFSKSEDSRISVKNRYQTDDKVWDIFYYEIDRFDLNLVKDYNR